MKTLNRSWGNKEVKGNWTPVWEIFLAFASHFESRKKNMVAVVKVVIVSCLIF